MKQYLVTMTKTYTTIVWAKDEARAELAADHWQAEWDEQKRTFEVKELVESDPKD